MPTIVRTSAEIRIGDRFTDGSATGKVVARRFETWDLGLENGGLQVDCDLRLGHWHRLPPKGLELSVGDVLEVTREEVFELRRQPVSLLLFRAGDRVQIEGWINPAGVTVRNLRLNVVVDLPEQPHIDPKRMWRPVKTKNNLALVNIESARAIPNTNLVEMRMMPNVALEFGEVVLGGGSGIKLTTDGQDAFIENDDGGQWSPFIDLANQDAIRRAQEAVRRAAMAIRSALAAGVDPDELESDIAAMSRPQQQPEPRPIAFKPGARKIVVDK